MIAITIGSKSRTWVTRKTTEDYIAAATGGEEGYLASRRGVALKRIDPEHEKWLNGGKSPRKGQSVLSQWWHGSR
jgi:hypothetical protein